VGRKAVYTRAELDAHKRRLPGSFATWIASGLAYEAEGDIGAALGEYAAIDEFSKDNLWASLHIGRLLLAGGDPDGASIYLRRALAAAPRSASVKKLLDQAGRRRRSRVRVGA